MLKMFPQTITYQILGSSRNQTALINCHIFCHPVPLGNYFDSFQPGRLRAEPAQIGQSARTNPWTCWGQLHGRLVASLCQTALLKVTVRAKWQGHLLTHSFYRLLWEHLSFTHSVMLPRLWTVPQLQPVLDRIHCSQYVFVLWYSRFSWLIKCTFRNPDLVY